MKNKRNATPCGVRSPEKDARRKDSNVKFRVNVLSCLIRYWPDLHHDELYNKTNGRYLLELLRGWYQNKIQEMCISFGFIIHFLSPIYY